MKHLSLVIPTILKKKKKKELEHSGGGSSGKSNTNFSPKAKIRKLLSPVLFHLLFSLQLEVGEERTPD